MGVDFSVDSSRGFFGILCAQLPDADGDGDEEGVQHEVVAAPLDGFLKKQPRARHEHEHEHDSGLVGWRAGGVYDE